MLYEVITIAKIGDMNKQYFETNHDWEKWLSDNYNTENELWLVYYKTHTGKTCISYEESVKTALCYGWIDGLLKKRNNFV